MTQTQTAYWWGAQTDKATIGVNNTQVDYFYRGVHIDGILLLLTHSTQIDFYYYRDPHTDGPLLLL